MASCYKWADTLRDSAKAKNFTISSDACAADRKMRMTPPRSFLYLPVTHAAAAQAQPARRAV